MAECISDEMMAAYVDGRLEPAERRSIETHLVGCNRCLEELTLLKQVADQETSLAGVRIPAAVLARAEQLIAERFGRRESIIDLAVRVAGNLVEVLRTTGEALTPELTPVPVRGRRRQGRRALVRKRVEDLDLIVEVESRDGEPVLRVLLGRADTDRPVHGVRIDLSSSSESETRFTENGLADFGPRKPDHYRIRIEDIGDVDLQIETP